MLAVVLLLLQAFLASLAAACEFCSFGGFSGTYVRLPSNVVNLQQPASDAIIRSLKSICDNELYVAHTASPGNQFFGGYQTGFRVLSRKLQRTKVNPIVIYSLLHANQKQLARRLFPNELVTTSLYKQDPLNGQVKEFQVTDHFTGVFQESCCQRSDDIRPNTVKQFDFDTLYLKEMLTKEKISKELFNLFQVTTNLMLVCLEESVNLDIDTPIYLELDNYIEAVSLMLPLFSASHNSLDDAIDKIIDLYDADLTLLARNGLNEIVPPNLSRDFVLLFATNSLLKPNHGLGDHEMCSLARLLVFQTALTTPTAGGYKCMKESINVCPVMETFMLEYVDLEDRLIEIRCSMDYYLSKFRKTWYPEAPLEHKTSVLSMYTMTHFAGVLMNFAVESNDDEKMVEALEFAYHALIVMMTGLQFTAQILLKPEVVKMLQIHLDFPDAYVESRYSVLLIILNMYENNFAVIRATYPSLGDALFYSIEVCRILSYTLYFAVHNGVKVTKGTFELCSVGHESLKFLLYIAESMEKHGMLSDWQYIKEIMLDSLNTFRIVSEDHSIGDNTSQIMKNYLVEIKDWSFKDCSKEDILKQIPELYKTGRRKNFSLDAILLRNKDAEAKKKAEQKNAKIVSVLSEDSKKQAKQPSKKQSGQKGQAKKKKRRGYNETKKKPKVWESTEEEPLFKTKVDAKFEDPHVVTDNIDAKLEVNADDSTDHVDFKAGEGQAPLENIQNSNGSSSESVIWNNAAATLFIDTPVTIEPRVVNQETYMPTHISSITDFLGYSYVEADPRDVAMALIIIGERVWKKHLEPLQNYLKLNEMGSLVQLLHQSLDKFEQEMNLLCAIENNFYVEMLSKANIKDSKHFNLCLKFYKQRVAIAHPHVPRLLKTKKNSALRHITVLERDDRVHQSLISTWRYYCESEDHVLVSSINTENRSKLLLDAEFTEYALAFVCLHEFYPCEQSLYERNLLAHKTVPNRIYEAYLNYIFLNHPDLEFLKAL